MATPGEYSRRRRLSHASTDAHTPKEQKWPTRSSVIRSPDTVSPIWPDRPIRPLPKNRLRSQLSPEQADSIVYPAQPPQSSPLFSFPYGLAEERDATAGAQQRVNGQRHASPTRCECGAYHQDNSEDEDGTAYDHPGYRWSSPDGDAAHGGRRGGQQQKVRPGRGGMAANNVKAPPPAPSSVASSADGYESFENTSNKKKRKIPLSGGSSVHQSSLTAELANMGLSSPPPDDRVNGNIRNTAPADAVAQYSAGVGTGISGPGRGRYGRHANMKADRRNGNTGTVMPGMNGYSSSLSARSRGGDYKGDGTRPGEKSATVARDEQ